MVLEFGYEWVNPLSWLDAISEHTIAVAVYLTGAIVVLSCWYALVKNWAKPFGAIAWLLAMTIICTPTISDGSNAGVAPAIFGFAFGVLTENPKLVFSNLSLLLFVFGIGLLAGFFWSKFSNQQHAQTQ